MVEKKPIGATIYIKLSFQHFPYHRILSENERVYRFKDLLIKISKKKLPELNVHLEVMSHLPTDTILFSFQSVEHIKQVYKSTANALRKGQVLDNGILLDITTIPLSQVTLLRASLSFNETSIWEHLGIAEEFLGMCKSYAKRS